MKKHLSTILLIALVAAISIGATLAYLTDEDKAVNTFTVGKVGIELDEAKVDEYGFEIEGADRVKTNEYKLIPGHSYVKDPMVTVDAGSEESYVRMIVKINKAAALKNVFGNDFLPQDFVKGWDANIWNTTTLVVEENDVLTYEFRYHKTVTTLEPKADKELEPLFTGIDFPGNVTAEQLLTLEGLQIDIEAHAIQADGFADADAAWAAFQK